MAILRKEDIPYVKPQIDLNGPGGNAFALMASCSGFAKKLNLDWTAIQADCMSGDYEHLVETLQKHFGDYVDFVR